VAQDVRIKTRIPVESGKPAELALLDQVIVDCLRIKPDSTAREISKLAASVGYVYPTGVIWDRLQQIYGTRNGGWVEDVRAEIRSFASEMVQAVYDGCTDAGTLPKDRAQIALKALNGMGVLSERRELTGKDGGAIKFESVEEAKRFLIESAKITMAESGENDPGCVPNPGDD